MELRGKCLPKAYKAYKGKLIKSVGGGRTTYYFEIGVGTRRLETIRGLVSRLRTSSNRNHNQMMQVLGSCRK